MALMKLSDLPGEGPLLGLDPGTKTIGVAVSDPLRTIATGLGTVVRRKFTADAAALFAYYDDRACVGLVVGMPVNMDGSPGPRAQSVRAFARNLENVRSVPLAYWDERLSTAAAERALLAADTSRAKRAEVVDALAAAFILQGALDFLHENDAALE